LQLLPGTVSKYWSTPALPGGAHLIAAALAEKASAAQQATKKSRSLTALA